MPTFDVNKDQINIFELNEEYVFTHCFDNKEINKQLKERYVEDQYQPEILTDQINLIKETLSEGFDDLVVIEDPAPFCVDKYKTYI